METIVTLQGKIRLERKDSNRIRATFFFGVDAEHLQNAGELVLTVGEWQNLAIAIGLGLEKMIQVQDEKRYVPIQIVVEGEMGALGRGDELDGGRDSYSMPGIDR